MRHVIRRLAADRRGATSTEYAICAALIAVVLATSFFAIGNRTSNHFESVGEDYHLAANG